MYRTGNLTVNSFCYFFEISRLGMAGTGLFNVKNLLKLQNI